VLDLMVVFCQPRAYELKLKREDLEDQYRLLQQLTVQKASYENRCSQT
jgi:hypothetical protein